MYAAAVQPDYVLVSETPTLYASASVSEFIEQEVRRPSKQWIASIIAGVQEKDQVILRTHEFVLLPDTERVNRYWNPHTSVTRASLAPPQPSRQWRKATCATRTCTPPPRETRNQKPTLNWLGIVLDLGVRTMRDLRGEHAPMLSRMLESAMSTIEAQAGIPRDQVMAYVHYPPSVYQLHVHFSYPYGQYCHRDAYRVHSLQTIINNLQIDPLYYDNTTLQLAMFRHSQHYLALFPPDPNTDSSDEGPADTHG
jgi:hypothetical protein